MPSLPSTLRTVIEKTMPLTVGVFAIMMVQLVDSIFIGMLGVNELAVHGITLPFQAAFTGVQVGIGVAATSIISQAVGAKDSRKASSMATLSVGAGMVVIALICFALILASDWVFHSFISGVPQQQYQRLLAVFNQYWPVWLLSALTVALLYLTTCIYRANGDTKTTGSMFLGASIINLILDPILIFWLDMGIVGAAVASSVGYLSCSIYMLMKVRGRGWFGVSDASIQQIKHDGSELVKTVVPTTMNQILPSVSAFFTMWLIARMGTSEMAFWSLLSRVESFVLVMSLALTMSIPPMIGRYLGAQQRHKIPQLLKTSAQFLLTFHIAIAALLALGSGVLASMLSDEVTIRHWFELSLLFIPLSFGPLGLCMLVASVFNALGQPKQALNVSFARLFIFYIPALWVGASTGEMLYAVAAAACANVLAGGFAWMRLSRYIKEKIQPQTPEVSCQGALSADS
ncbi:polysaccharide biosynthesis C-terminal domain-containing protein [Vibrio sp. D404a]|uniref:MATE family efflux transporter n=1 Tax=unclassified Vibrio TaxID=2614977 RepID=UPI002553AE27|nr:MULTISPECIES: MATE family efflux transporter [unclassified Vibrio]MDK9736841.1 polysaccharide biosynthesis C-terminal domain-containing protein [Vibrio sp. D404a]MDK9795741.1 polysaccharide biosynthesis C-terminal domain-containing protein [Vibrio sp. D449a]